MSADLAAEKSAGMMCCANCGKAEIDDIKLKDCNKCDLAKYCGDECQQNHLDIHDEKCKVRAAELRDEILFRQNESSYLGDCPLCFLPMPLDVKKHATSTCCSKAYCSGCVLANVKREANDRLEPRCPFCRKLALVGDQEDKRKIEKRAEANDPAALSQLGVIHCKEGEYGKAFEYYTRAATLGDVHAHYQLAVMYEKGDGVEKDEKMTMYHLEEAAIAGDHDARFYLGVCEGKSERFDRAVKHWIIAANLGHDDSIELLKHSYKSGLVSKDDLATALRAHQAAVDAMKSPQREESAERLEVLL